MANKELHCTDNYTLPKGDRGPRGEQGDAGLQGPAGPGSQGPQGPVGGTKIDINIQSESKPYTELYSNNQADLAFFIFPGTLVFNPTTWRVAFSMVSVFGNNTLRVEMGYINPDGSKQIVAGFTETRQESEPRYIVKEISSFNNLPDNAVPFYISASVTLPSQQNGQVVTRVYATEIR